MKKASIVSLILIFLLYSCDSKSPDARSRNSAVIPSVLEIKLDRSNYNVTSGDSVVIHANSAEIEKSFSEISLLVNGKQVYNAPSFPFEFTLKTDSLGLGRILIKLSAFDGKKMHGKSLTFTLFSSIIPKKYSYEVVNVYEHDVKAYTQGLVFHNGVLYEGTGHKRSSSLRKVDLESGKVQKTLSLDDKIFGEGITYLDDHLIQLSWQSQVAFVYDMDFNELKRFYYKGEGWGLTNDSNHLIRSDGSHKLYFHNASNFNIEREVEVYSNESVIDKLNELEYIKGKIYANIWQKNDLAIIDPLTGAVEGIVDLKNILPKKFRDKRTEVLNGIAYDAESDRIFVTGKYWSKLFEIKIVEQASL